MALLSVLVLLLIISECNGHAQAASEAVFWPQPTRENHIWAYWWWPGSAVDTTNITRQLQRFHDAGMGGVHIIPIYGAKGWETNYIDYLSPKWMSMLQYTVEEGKRLDLGVDMTLGTGWCFGGPRVTEEEANAVPVVKTFEINAGNSLTNSVDRAHTQALMAFSDDGRHLDLLPKLDSSGRVNWIADKGTWKIYVVSQKPSGVKVKRSSPGGEGPMLNLFYPQAMIDYTKWFDDAFKGYDKNHLPRAVYHDSYEYRSEWSPDLFAQFAKRRGYRLQDHLPALFGSSGGEDTGRVKSDYRETISEVMAEESLANWVKWSHTHGFITRNEAHGSPGNLLDLYAVADVPETEMFHTDRNKLISKFSSSAAHVAGHRLVGAETGTWLKEHFTVTLADMKYLFDDLFLSGVNHMFYHGTCYSPAEAGWPGWFFYASTEMNPRNSIWHDVPALNSYAMRCQSILQSGEPDNDILLYWPIYDYWKSSSGLVQQMTIHAEGWFAGQSIGKAAARLWNRGYAFDYISDHLIGSAAFKAGSINLPGGNYHAVVVPHCEIMPADTFSKMVSLARDGATVIFENQLPTDVPGLGQLEERRQRLHRAIDLVAPSSTNAPIGMRDIKLGRGRILVGELEACLIAAAIDRESMTDHPGLYCIRRAIPGGRYYFIANRGEEKLDTWIPLAKPARSVAIMDPLTGAMGLAAARAATSPDVKAEVYLQLDPGQSLLLRAASNNNLQADKWPYSHPGTPAELKGKWSVKFLEGGPGLPPPFETYRLASWTEIGDEPAQAFAGTAHYTLTFDAPEDMKGSVVLNLGNVCQSARVRLNGTDYGTLITSPFRIVAKKLKPSGNKLEIEVTNLSANRIRDLDRRGVKWKIMRDINIVNINYKPFDASEWPIMDAGLLGPVTVSSAESFSPQ